MTGISLEQLSDGEMYEFFESGIRGGVSQISKCYARANNPAMKDFDPQKCLPTLQYVDCNNLYGKAMSESLPHRDFRRLTRDEILQHPALDKIADDGPYEYAMEVDMIVPTRLHDDMNDFPLAAENLEIDETMLSPFQRDRFPKKSQKLPPNLMVKECSLCTITTQVLPPKSFSCHTRSQGFAF